MNYSIFLTVVVCTYNRSDLLAGCLESLCQQTIKKDKFEIILVDNNSTDNTSEIAKGFLDQSNFRYLLETSPGLSHARNRGLNEAKGEYVGYIDDDARAKYDWLETAINIIESRAYPHNEIIFAGFQTQFPFRGVAEWILHSRFAVQNARKAIRYRE